MVNFRKPARQLYYRRRHQALTTNNACRSQIYRRLFLILLHVLKNTSQPPDKYARLQLAARFIGMCYLSLIIEPFYHLERPIRRDRDIQSFSASECNINFRFNKEHLPRLLELLRFPAWVHFPNRAKMRGEEVFLRGLLNLKEKKKLKHIFIFIYCSKSYKLYYIKLPSFLPLPFLPKQPHLCGFFETD